MQACSMSISVSFATNCFCWLAPHASVEIYYVCNSARKWYSSTKPGWRRVLISIFVYRCGRSTLSRSELSSSLVVLGMRDVVSLRLGAVNEHRQQVGVVSSRQFHEIAVCSFHLFDLCSPLTLPTYAVPVIATATESFRDKQTKVSNIANNAFESILR